MYGYLKRDGLECEGVALSDSVRRLKIICLESRDVAPVPD
jgi:hypothetical protein